MKCQHNLVHQLIKVRSGFGLKGGPLASRLSPLASCFSPLTSCLLPLTSCFSPLALNDCSRWNDRVFGDDHDAVADGVGVSFCFADVVCILDADVFADTGVFVDDRAVDDASRTNADVWDAFLVVVHFVVGCFVKISPHHDRVREFDVRADDAANADDGVFDFRVSNVGPIADFALLEVATIQFGGGQVARVRVDGRVGLIKGEWRVRSCEREVGFVKGADRANVFPVSLKPVGIDLVALNGSGDDVVAKVIAVVLVQEFF